MTKPHTNASAMAAIARGDLTGNFSRVTSVSLDNLPGLTALPEFPAATYVWLDGRRVA